MQGLRFRVLGPVEIVDASGSGAAASAPGGSHDSNVPLGSRSQLAILSVLLAHRGQYVRADTLMQVLWGDTRPRTARQTLRSYVSRLRQLVGEGLTGLGDGYRLAADDDAVDAGRFERLVRAARDAPAPEAIGVLTAALALWRGPAFADMADLEPVRAAARSLDQTRIAARESLCRALLLAGRASEAVPVAEALVAEDVLNEGGWVLLLDSLAASGRVAEGLAAYRRAQRALAREGIDPSPMLRQAHAAVLRATVPDPGTVRARDPGPGTVRTPGILG
jgi:DNA-binding SARP family transcriptional activator